MTDRFDLEEEITSTWALVETSLAILTNSITERKMTNDEILTALHGISMLTNMKFDKMFGLFSAMIKDGTIT